VDAAKELRTQYGLSTMCVYSGIYTPMYMYLYLWIYTDLMYLYSYIWVYTPIRYVDAAKEMRAQYGVSTIFLATDSADVVTALQVCVATCCSVLQCVAVCCSVLQCVAVCCSVL